MKSATQLFITLHKLFIQSFPCKSIDYRHLIKSEECLVRYLLRLYALPTLEAYRCVQVLKAKYFHRLVCHLNDIALNDVVLSSVYLRQLAR